MVLNPAEKPGVILLVPSLLLSAASDVVVGTQRKGQILLPQGPLAEQRWSWPAVRMDGRVGICCAPPGET